jgi:molecular chaperone Hsp33
MAGHAPPFGDFIQPFQVERLGVRGRLARLGPGLAAAIGPHGYPSPVPALLAETAALAATLASTLKFDGIFTLQVQGDGPVGMLMADVTSKGGFRAYARVDRERLAGAGGNGGMDVGRLLGKGYLAFTVDQGPDTDRYQGITELQGTTLAESAEAYFRQSEQLETAIVTAASAPAGGRPRAALIMVQRLPSPGAAAAADDDAAADDWRRAAALMASVTAGELLDPALAPSELLYRLYHEDGVRVYRTKPLVHACRCSRDKVKVTLASFQDHDIRDMADDGRVTVTCEFCKATYAFDVDELTGRWHGGAGLEQRRATP